MGILDQFDFENVPELSAVEEGEYELRIIDAGQHIGKESGKESIHLAFDVISEPDAETIHHYMSLPTGTDEPKVTNAKLRRIKNFFTASGLGKEVDFSEWVGTTLFALLGVEEDSQTGLPRNRIKRFIGGH